MAVPNFVKSVKNCDRECSNAVKLFGGRSRWESLQRCLRLRAASLLELE